MSGLIYGPVLPDVYNPSYYSFFATRYFYPVALLHPERRAGSTIEVKGVISLSSNKHRVYCLSLADDKYYIEWTNCINKRLTLHREGKACAWTTAHELIDVVEIIDVTGTKRCNEDVDVIVLHYMRQYGIDNVRGGSFSSVKLTDHDYEHLRRKLHTQV